MFEEEQKVDIKLEKKDVEQLFKKEKKSNIGVSILKAGGILIAILIVGFGIVNAPALYANTKYYVYNDILKKDMPTSTSNLMVSADKPLTNKNNHLIIPKIDVDSSIQWNIGQPQIKEKLKKGLIHLKDSSLPSDESGNVFIIGHSSYYGWIGNKAASVFSLLHQLEPDDMILFAYDNNNYLYQVSNVSTSKSAEIRIDKPSNKKILTLMTYSPIGIYINKLFVTAEFVKQSESVNEGQTKEETDAVEKFEESSESQPTATKTPEASPTPNATVPAPAQDLKFLPEVE